MVRTGLLSLTIVSGLLLAAHAHGYAAGYFLDRPGVFSTDVSMFNKWTGMLKYQAKHLSSLPDRCGNSKYKDCDHEKLEQFTEGLRSEPVRQQIEDVNTYMNAHPYTIDQVNWGKEDYWEIPHEFEDVNGDCEDYAISKYMALRELGVSMDDMQIVILQDLNLGGIIHAILAVKYDDEYLVLDNQIKTTMPAKKIYHYRPIYALNETGWWRY